MIMDEHILSIQQTAEVTGLSEHTLRYYERIGLIHPINRAESGHRQYTPDDVGWIDLLNKLRSTGMSIQQMQRYAELQREGEHTLPERLEILKAHRIEVEARIDELQDYLQVIRHKIDYYQEVVAEQLQESPDLA